MKTRRHEEKNWIKKAFVPLCLKTFSHDVEQVGVSTRPLLPRHFEMGARKSNETPPSIREMTPANV